MGDAINQNEVVPAHQPAPSRSRRAIRQLGVVVMLAFVLAYFATPITGHPEVRLDSGDRRRCWLIFSWSEPRLPETERELLLASAKQMDIPAVWHRVIRYAPSYTDAARRHHFIGVARWLREEPGFGRILHKNLVEHYLHEADAESGSPSMGSFIFAAAHSGEREHPDLSIFGDQEQLARRMDEIGYTPRPEGWLAEAYARSKNWMAPYAAVLVDSVTPGEGSKYYWQHARVVKIMQRDERREIGSTIHFAHLNTTGDVRDGRWVLYLERMEGPPAWWRLYRYEAEK